MTFTERDNSWRSDCERYEIFPITYRDGCTVYKAYHLGKPLYGEHVLVELAKKQCAIDAGER